MIKFSSELKDMIKAMKRDPRIKQMFVGTEVENSPHKGLKTLFVAGLYPVKAVLERAKVEKISHIYLAANQSYCSATPSEWKRLAYFIAFLDLKVTLNLPLTELENYLDAEAPAGYEFEKNDVHFMLSVSARRIQTLNSKATIKFDDDMRSVVNPGVWCVPVSTLLDDTNFTPWSAYKDDKLDEGN